VQFVEKIQFASSLEQTRTYIPEIPYYSVVHRENNRFHRFSGEKEYF